MKQTIKKSLIILCVILIFTFSSLAYPMQQAKAGPLLAAVPAGLTAGAGAYLTGGLMLSGLAGVAGYHEYQKAIQDHSWNVWDGGTQGAKDSMNLMIQSAVGAGDTLQQVDQGVNEWVESSLGKIAQMAYTTVNVQSKTENGMTITPFRFASTTGTLSAQSGVETTGNSFLINGKRANAFQILVYSSGNVTVRVYEVLASGGERNVEFSISSGTYGHTRTQLNNIMQLAETVSDVFAVLSILGVSYTIVDSAMHQDYIGIERNISEAWESMRDAGLVLPVDGATAWTPANNTRVRYNEQEGAYTDASGRVYNPGDINWAFPQPRIREAGGTISLPGVWVDTPAYTGNPTVDKEIDITRDTPFDIPFTTTHITTGTTIANPDIATGNPAIPINPPATTVPPIIPPFDAPGTTGLDFTPLIMAGEVMKNKFPFSIPFDFVKQISVFNVEPESPKFNINIPEFIKLGSFVIPFKMNLSFEMFDPIANIIRWGMIIIWDIALILSLRRLLPE